MSIAFLPIIQAYIAQYGMSIILVLGNIGNTFVILLFYQRRRTACSIYLSCAALINIIYLTFNIPIYIYTYLRGDPTSNSLIFCKLRFYLSHIFGQMARYFIILVCSDRYLITNINFHQRRFNRPIIAKYLILIVTIFWCIIGSHQLIFTTIDNQRCGQFGIYYIINSIYLLIVFSIIPLVLMIIFGYLTYRQIKQLHARVRPLASNINRFIVHRRDRELSIMILIEVFIYFLTMILFLSISLELLSTFYMTENKTIERIQIENFITIFSVFLIYMNHAAPFYIYILVSKRLRRDFKNIFRKCCRQTTTTLVIELQ
jgi:hypothetical protein